MQKEDMTVWNNNMVAYACLSLYIASQEKKVAEKESSQLTEER